jgi:peptide/nickel transport system substrate-binding protein
VAGGLAAALVIASAVACSPSSSNSEAGRDEIIVAYSSDVDTLDPHQFRSNAAYAVVGNLYGTLLQEDYAEPKGGLLEYAKRSTPYLAESAIWNSARTALTFKLRSDSTFADGSKITAEDVAYSMRRALSDVGYASAVGAWLNVKDAKTGGVTVVDESTVRLDVTHYSPLIEQFLTFQIFAVLDESAAKAAATKDDPWSAKFLAKQTTASGPYVVDSRIEGQSITLKKNPNFKATDLSGAADRVVVQNLPDSQQAFLALQNGAVDLLVGLTPDIAQAVSRDSRLKLYDLPYSDVVYLGMNNKDPQLRDVRVRQAISYLMPYDVLRKDLMKGYAGAAYGAVPYPMSDALDESGEKVAYGTDVAKAKALLQAAGVTPGGLSLTLSVPVGDVVMRQAAVFIQSALGQGGVSVKVNQMSDADYNANLGKLQLFLDSWYSWGQDSIYQLYFLLKSGIFTNYTNFADKQLDQLIAQAMATTDTAERHRLSQQAQQLVIDQAPWAFLFTRNTLIGARADVTGITHSNDANLRFDRLRVEPKAR